MEADVAAKLVATQFLMKVFKWTLSAFQFPQNASFIFVPLDINIKPKNKVIISKLCLVFIITFKIVVI